MLFDANCAGGCSGGDNDLQTPGAGNILIISQDNNSMNPNDSRFGGTIVVEFEAAISEIAAMTVDVGDSDNGPNFFEVFFNNVLVDTINLILGQGDNNLQNVMFSGGPFNELRLTLAGSGGLVKLDFTPVPLPPALPLFMAGLLALFGMRRKSIA